MNLRQIDIFVKVAETGSLSQAAVFLETVQPILSRQIRGLEQELHVELFHRTGRGLKLTEAGERLLQRSKDILSNVELAKQEMSAFTRSQLTEIAVAFSPTIGQAIVRPFVRELFKLHPEIRLRILEGVSGYIGEWLATRKVDVAVTYFTDALARMSFEELSSEELYLISSKRKNRFPASLSFKDIKDIPLILPGEPHGLRVQLEEAAKHTGTRLDIRIEADSFSTIKQLIQEGVGCSTLPLSAIKAEIRQGEFCVTKITEPVLKRRLVVITNSGRVPASGLKEVVKIIKALGHLYLPADLPKRVRRKS
jgi:LysR family nitrogen assimilation transcriptional regulator